jgi:oligopeptide transport system substrate-binding protein
MHSKIKSSFLLPLFAIVLAACGATPSSSSQVPSSSSPSVPSSSSTSVPSSSSSLAPVVMTFDAKGGSAVSPVTVAANGSVAAPTAPTYAGHRFGGWFRGRAGLTWLEPEAVSFPMTAVENMTLYAYWEPLVSKDAVYTADQTYYSTISSTAQRFILNPMTYETATENSIMSSLSTSLYTSEVDWDKAMEQGVANFVGDFSKIESQEYSIEALDFITILQGATSFPKNGRGNDFTIDGKYDRDNATKITSKEWTFELREDVFFEDGTQVTAETYEYTLEQFLDPVQNNFRATSYYKDDANKSGLPIVNASEYLKQTTDNPVPFSDVGFEIIDNFAFRLKFWEAVPQSFAVGFGNIQLVQPTVFEASLNGGNSSYGTPANPFRSYGPYVIKSWNENQLFVLNKNFDFIRKDTITYKSISYSFTATVEENMNLFEAGSLSSVGLIGEFYTEYAEDPNVKREWAGYPQYLIVNTAPSTLATNPHQKHPIVQDPRFRQALFFGFNRAAYNSTIYAPNTPSVLPVPVDTKGYTQDPLYYSESPNHLENLEDFDITEGSNGYIPERAIALFNAAMTDYLTKSYAVTGPVTLKLLTSDNALSVELSNYIKSMYETLFNTNPASPDKLIINVVAVPAASVGAIRAAWDFDLLSINLGFGLSRGVWWQFAAFGLLGGGIVPQFGLTIPFTGGLDAQGNTTLVDLTEDEDSWIMQDITVDLTPTYDYLVELGEDFVYEQDEDDDGDLFYVNSGFAWLMDELAPTATKAAGLYAGSLYALADYVYNENTPWDAAAAEPFPGATEEVWKVTAAFEKVFLQQMPLIPTSTLSSATLYADNVTITWPTYSIAFGWGAARYRYLNSDTDFADGLYNAFEAAYLATLE